jgi:hypothetical protein
MTRYDAILTGAMLYAMRCEREGCLPQQPSVRLSAVEDLLKVHLREVEGDG